MLDSAVNLNIMCFPCQIFCRSYYQIDQSLYPNEPGDMDILANNFKVSPTQT